MPHSPNPWLQEHPMICGVFDGWHGSPHPALHAHTAIQDFETMGAHAAKKLLKWMKEGIPPKNLKENIPLKELKKVLPLWQK